MISLNVNQLHVEYSNPRTRQTLCAVQDISFTVQPGEFVAMVGPSGCGKTTLLHTIAGLVPYQSGSIRVGDNIVRGPDANCAMVFQSPALLPWRTVLDNAAYGLELRGHTRTNARRTAQEYLSLVGLIEFASSYPYELSGGMQQRVNLARALGVRPNLLLFDEPLSSLDAQTRDVMMWEIQRLWLKHQTTVLYITHQISEALSLASRVIVLSARPARILEIISVPAPYPRNRSSQRTPQFLDLEQHMWELLRREISPMASTADE